MTGFYSSSGANSRCFAKWDQLSWLADCGAKRQSRVRGSRVRGFGRPQSRSTQPGQIRLDLAKRGLFTQLPRTAPRSNPRARDCGTSPGFEADIAVLDLHRRPDVDLHPDGPVRRPVRRIVVDGDAHQPAVEEVHQRIAADDQVDGVPIVGGGCRELRGFAERREDDRRTCPDDAGDLAAHADEEPSLLLVIVADVPPGAVEIELIAAHRELVVGRDRVWNARAAVVDAAVPARGDPVVELQLEVLRAAACPDDERVALDDGGRGDLSDQYSVFGAPVFGVAFPTAERLAIEDWLKAGLVALDGSRSVALLGDERRSRLLCRRERREQYRSDEDEGQC